MLVSTTTSVPSGLSSVHDKKDPATSPMLDTSIGVKVNVCDGLYPDVSEIESESTDGVTDVSVVPSSTRYCKRALVRSVACAIPGMGSPLFATSAQSVHVAPSSRLCRV